MTPELEALERVRSANPVPDEEHLGGSDLTSLFAAVEQRRSTMSTGMRERNRSEERPIRRRLVPVAVFAAALLLVVVGIGLVPALLRSNQEIAPADEPATTTVQQATTTTTQEPATTVAPETTVTTEAPAVTTVSGEWALVHEGEGTIVGLPAGGFVVAGENGDRVVWSPDGTEWLDADPEGVIEGDAGGIQHGAVIGDRVVLAGFTCEQPSACPGAMGIWIGDPRTGEWEMVSADDADLISCAGLGAEECDASVDALAASSAGVVVVGSATTGPPIEQGGWLMYQTDWSIWRADSDVSGWIRTDLPDPLGFGSVIWQRVADGEASGEYRYGPVTGYAGGWLMALEVETWPLGGSPFGENLLESFLLRSDDAETWTVVDGAPEVVRGIASGGDAVVAVGGIHSEILYRSADGETWEEVFSEGEDTWFADVTYVEQYGFVALASVPVEPPATPPGDDEMGPGDHDIDLLVSADGRVWSLVGAAATTEARREPRFVAVSGDAILVSGYGSDPEGSSDEGVTGIWMLVTD